MHRLSAAAVPVCLGILGGACQAVPSAERGAAAVPAVELDAPPPPPDSEVLDETISTGAVSVGGSEPGAERRESLSCRCDVLGFESDGPPRGRCTLEFGADGSATLTGVTSAPAFSAHLVPIEGRQKRAVDYVFEGAFDFACDEAWCGHQQLSVLAIADFDYRVTVARSADGPPSHVLWVTCKSR